MLATNRQRRHKDQAPASDQAMSAGTIFCMSGDKIFMDYSSSLGPIDPQVHNGKDWVPALGYLDQVERMIKKSADGTITDAELIILQNQDLAMLSRYEQAKNLLPPPPGGGIGGSRKALRNVATALYRLLPAYTAFLERAGRAGGRRSVGGHSPLLAFFLGGRSGSSKLAITKHQRSTKSQVPNENPPPSAACRRLPPLGWRRPRIPGVRRPRWSFDEWGLESRRNPPTGMSALRKPA